MGASIWEEGVDTGRTNADQQNDNDLAAETIQQSDGIRPRYRHVTVNIAESELAYLHRQSKKLRLASPQDVYEFRHVEHHWGKRIVHFITLLCSFSMFLYCFLVSYLPEKVDIPGLGSVTNATPIDKLSVIAIMLIVFFACRHLFSRRCIAPSKTYRLAMLANSFNRAILNIVYLQILYYALIGILFFGALVGETDLAKQVRAKADYTDTLEAIGILILMFVIYRAFRFCFKEQSV